MSSKTPLSVVSDHIESVKKVVRDQELAPMSGDCGIIAVGLQTVFGGDLVGSYANEVDFHQMKPAHVAVRCDGQLIDGSGITSREALRDRACYNVTAKAMDDAIVCEIKEGSYRIYDPETTQQFVQQLRCEVARVSTTPP